jgi:hypothetical protein
VALVRTDVSERRYVIRNSVLTRAHGTKSQKTFIIDTAVKTSQKCSSTLHVTLIRTVGLVRYRF